MLPYVYVTFTLQLADVILDVTDALMRLPQQLMTSSQLRDKACTRFGCFYTVYSILNCIVFRRHPYKFCVEIFEQLQLAV